jgi:hypothetical protein
VKVLRSAALRSPNGFKKHRKTFCPQQPFSLVKEVDEKKQGNKDKKA